MWFPISGPDAGSDASLDAGPETLTPADLLLVVGTANFKIRDYMGIAVCDGAGTMTFEEVGLHFGRQALRRAHYCIMGETFFSDVGGDVHIEQVGVWIEAVIGPVQDGATFNSGVQGRWEYIGTRTVAAGQFSNCWRVVDTGQADSFSEYFPGIGLVYTRAPAFNREAELLSFSP